jgi:hypothetical protein
MLYEEARHVMCLGQHVLVHASFQGWRHLPHLTISQTVSCRLLTILYAVDKNKCAYLSYSVSSPLVVILEDVMSRTMATESSGRAYGQSLTGGEELRNLPGSSAHHG